MKRAIVLILLLVALTAAAKPAQAAGTQILVQTTLGRSSLGLVCLLSGCQVSQSLVGSPTNFFVLNYSSTANVSYLVSYLEGILGILRATPVGGTGNPIGNGYIVHTTGGLLNLPLLCDLGLCSAIQSLDGAGNQVFLLAGSSNENPLAVLGILRALPGILNAELNQVVGLTTGSATATTPPPSLVNTTPMKYYNSTVWTGYVNQPATEIIRLSYAQEQYGLAGKGIIADIDTGVDTNHPVLVPVLVPGYDFTRNQPGGSEMNDLPSGTPAPESPCVNCTPGRVNQHSIAMVDQHSIAMVDQPGYQDFGHGTMVAGILHLVAPTAQIMPLKAFGPDGTGNLANILRAIYYASQAKVTLVNMSFDLTSPSQELASAISSAEQNGVLFAASAGNDGKMEMVYPAGYTNVMGVASTNDQDQRSTFSNYGNQIVWVAAPGEAVITTYPFGTYAAAWGTSFSAPMVTATVDLIKQKNAAATQATASLSVAQAQLLLAYGMGNGRLDVYRAVTAALE